MNTTRTKLINLITILTMVLMCVTINTNTVNAATKAPGKPTISSVKISSQTNTSVNANISIKKVKNAKTYQVYYQQGSSAWKNAGSFNTTNINKTFNKSTSSVKYTFKVRCKGTGKYKKWSKWSTTKTLTVSAKAYTVKFKDSVKSNTFASKTVLHGKTVPIPSKPSITGYHFIAWCDDDASPINLNTYKITKNQTIWADYDLNTYTVTFKNGVTGKTITTTKGEYNEIIPFPSNPIMVGYNFTGWDAPVNSRFTSNKTITANFSKIKYSVTFKNGITNANITTKIVEHGNTVSFPTPPSMNGYEFTGWDANPNDVITSNKTITANYKTVEVPVQTTKIEVLYKLGTGSDTSLIKSDTIPINQLYTLPTVPQKKQNNGKNYTFNRWMCNSYCQLQNSETSISNKVSIISNNGTAVVLAVYTEDAPTTYNVTFKDGYTGNTIDSMTVNQGSSVEPPEPPQHDGYIFKYWDSTAYTNVQSDLVITAYYEEDIPPVTTYTYQFIDSITNETISQGEINEGTAVPRPNIPTHKGYLFQGWDKSDDVLNNIQSNLTIHTIYNEDPNAEFTITFVNPVNNQRTQVNVLRNYSATPPDFPEVINSNKANFKYYFTGWDSDDYMNVTKDATITAQYNYEELYCIEFYDGYNDDLIDVSKYYRSGTPIQSIPKPRLSTHTGYLFNYWDGDSEDALTENISMTAVFTKAYTVQFKDAQTNTKIAENQTVMEDGQVVLPTPPEKNGWQFIGWYKDQGMTDPFNYTTDVITSNRTIYAGYVRSYSADEENFINTYNNAHITLWALDNEYDRGISMPDVYTTELDISTLVNTNWDIYVDDILIDMQRYANNDSYSDSTNKYKLLIQDGNLVPRFHYWEQTGQSVFIKRDNKYYNDLSYYTPNNNIYKRYDFGEMNVRAVRGDREVSFTVTVNDYADIWADERVNELMPLAYDEWLTKYGGKTTVFEYRDENHEVINTINETTPTTVDGMTNHQKLSAVAIYLTNHFDYSAYNFTDIYTLMDNAGDCWGNSKIICRAAKILGLKTHVHLVDANYTRGHQIATVDLGNNLVGFYDAGTASGNNMSSGVSPAPRPAPSIQTRPYGCMIKADTLNAPIDGYTKRGCTVTYLNEFTVEPTDVYYQYKIADFDTFTSGTVSLPDKYSTYQYQMSYQNKYIRGPIETVKIKGITTNQKGFSALKSIQLLSNLPEQHRHNLIINDSTKVTKILVPSSYQDIDDSVTTDLTKLNYEYTDGETYTIDEYSKTN